MTAPTMRVRISVLAILSLGALMLPAHRAGAAEAEPPPVAAPQPGKSGDAAGADSGKPEQDRGPSTEVFVPTEEISEDYAVSFPVDI